MSLRRRLLIYLLICAPLVWGLALVWSARSARQEVNEMFDTELVRLARQVQAVTAPLSGNVATPQRDAVPGGAADLDDLAIAIWDREGIRLPPLEWSRQPGGRLSLERQLPNGIDSLFSSERKRRRPLSSSPAEVASERSKPLTVASFSEELSPGGPFGVGSHYCFVMTPDPITVTVTSPI